MSITELNIPVIRYPITDSTNIRALELAGQDALHGTIIRADRQTKGRGRGDHHFSSPVGGLYMSIILRPRLAPEQLSLITLVAGLVCALIVEEEAGFEPQLKWPNDLYFGSGKLAGILTESGSFSGTYTKDLFIVVGIGMNVNSSPVDFDLTLRDRVTSLSHVTARYYDLDQLMLKITRKLLYFIDNLEELTQYLFSQWQKRDYLFNRKLTWHSPDRRVIQGKGLGIYGDGRYQILDGNGQNHLILAGDILPDSLGGYFPTSLL